MMDTSLNYIEEKIQPLKGTAVSSFVQAAFFGVTTLFAGAALLLGVFDGPSGAVLTGVMAGGAAYAAVRSAQKCMRRLNLIF